MTYRNRKLVAGSSPKVEDTSLIAKLYAESDQRVFEIECPHCRDHFELLWRHIEWEPDRPETAHAICPECGSVIEESDKAAAVERGRWRATHPEVRSGYADMAPSDSRSVNRCGHGHLACKFSINVTVPLRARN